MIKMDDAVNLINFIQGFVPEKPEKKSKNKNDSINDSVFDKAITYSVMAPLIVDQRWPEVSDDLKLKAKAYRMAKSLECIQQEMSTEFDAFVYLHTASLAQPLDHHLYSIYFFLFQKFFSQQAEQLNIKVNELSRYERNELDELRSWIFKQQINIVKQRIRGENTIHRIIFLFSNRLGGVILPADSIPQMNRIPMNKPTRTLN